MTTVFKGIKLVWGDPELRPFIYRPLFRAIPILLLLFVVTFFVMQPLAGLLLSLIGAVEWLVSLVAGVLTVALWWVLLGPVFFTIAIFISAFSWESLSKKVEDKAFPHLPTPTHQTSFAVSFRDNMRRLPRTIVVSVLSALTAPIFFGVISAAIAGWQARYDFTAPAYMRRGVLWPEQRQRTKALRGQKELALASAVFAWIPIINLLALPGLVAAGSMMVAESDTIAADLNSSNGRIGEHAGETR